MASAVKIVKVRYGENKDAVYACDDVGLSEMRRFMGLKNVRLMMEGSVCIGSYLRLTEYSSFSQGGREVNSLDIDNIARARVVPFMIKIRYYDSLSDFIMVKCEDIEYMSMNSTNPDWFRTRAEAINRAKLEPVPTFDKHDMYVREVFKEVWGLWFRSRRAKLERMRELMREWQQMNFVTATPLNKLMCEVIGERLPA